ncbi:cholinesterase 2-like isoform X2 [Rhipicephalus microplus]|uniref:cholinesterase 2-like isoform X2 n=1 Tax=Rhipicephalus microplus TaxID=6941 RepID=UPI003F6ABC7B
MQLYDGRYLAALGNLVVVVPNYRVGALGFLCGPTQKGIPGNAGLQDQRLAFEWTLANIVSFGGDTSQMVLAGHDAGASSLGYHLFYGDVAFWTRNVTRFILQSGGPYHRYESQGMEGARRLAESLHCSPSNLSTDRAVSCLQDADVGAVARNPLALNFGPVFNRAPLSMPIEAHNGQAVSGTKRRHVEGSEFLLGRAASEGVYTWYVAQHRSASGDLRRLAARLLGDEVLERWQTATGITLDADSPVAVYQQAVGDVLEGATCGERQMVPVRQRPPQDHEVRPQGDRRARRRQVARVRHRAVGAVHDSNRPPRQHHGAARRRCSRRHDILRLRHRSGRAGVGQRCTSRVVRTLPHVPKDAGWNHGFLDTAGCIWALRNAGVISRGHVY